MYVDVDKVRDTIGDKCRNDVINEDTYKYREINGFEDRQRAMHSKNRLLNVRGFLSLLEDFLFRIGMRGKYSNS